uniref:Protein RER1 n=1 Tax=Aegilops tauschii TaxID=37682 RepID=R7WBK8_AEGTA
MEPVGGGGGGASSAAERYRAEAARAFQHYLDRAAPHTAGRWAGTLLAAAVYALRVYYVQGFYVVSSASASTSSTSSSASSPPWYAITKAFCVAFVMTFFSVFDVPVFWPILLCYWIVLFVLTMKRQILHMVKYKYVPFSMGKQKYGGKKGPSTSGSKD